MRMEYAYDAMLSVMIVPNESYAMTNNARGLLTMFWASESNVMVREFFRRRLMLTILWASRPVPAGVWKSQSERYEGGRSML